MIQTNDELAALVKLLDGERLLACDMEGDSLHHYQERVCLIQISTPSDSFLVDPLTVSDMSPLAPVMADPAVRKVFHGADYDIRSLHRDFGIEVNNLFDTMVACQLLGEKELGLAAVLKKRFGVDLDKRYQKADWSKRPLSREMIDYAIRDTNLLIDLYGQLEQELAAKGRLYWLEEECALLSRVRSVPRNGEPLFHRFKGAAKMDSRTLTVLEELLRFREEKARLRDVPPFKIVGNDYLRIIAEKKPRKRAELKDACGLPASVADRYGYELLGAVERGVATPSDRLRHYPRVQRVVREREQEERLRCLKEWREAKSRELGVDAGLLANNALLEALAETAPHAETELEKVPALKQWQKKEFGAEIVAATKG